MLRKTLIISLFILLALSLAAVTACSDQTAAASGGSNNSNTVVKQTRIKAQLTGDTVTIPVSDLDKYGNVNFLVYTATDNMAFMAYRLGGQTYVKADVCVPCGSESFTLNKGKLVCDSCGTVFDAQTGKGVSGVKACQGYPKQPVVFQISSGNLVMNGTDLVNAFQSTLHPKKS
jgi:nitrite reductase/ring-hydroxylating ferredoxin subunit